MRGYLGDTWGEALWLPNPFLPSLAEVSGQHQRPRPGRHPSPTTVWGRHPSPAIVWGLHPSPTTVWGRHPAPAMVWGGPL